MTKTKIGILFLFLSLGIQQQSYSQIYKFSTSGLSVLEKDENGKWGNWSDLDLVNIIVALDTNKNRIVIYSERIQLFEIVEYQNMQENDTDIVHSFTCLDNIGVNCTLSIITRKNQDNRKQLYINYGDRIILYNIFNM